MNPGQILIFFNNTGLKLILFFAHLIQFGSPWKMISLASGGSLPVEHIFPALPHPSHCQWSQLSPNLKLPLNFSLQLKVLNYYKCPLEYWNHACVLIQWGDNFPDRAQSSKQLHFRHTQPTEGTWLGTAVVKNVSTSANFCSSDIIISDILKLQQRAETNLNDVCYNRWLYP